MISYAGECFNAGLFSLLTVVLKPTTPGYEAFKNKSSEALENLGFAEKAITDVILHRGKRTAEEVRKSLREDMEVIIDNSYGETGALYYEIGFWCGTLLLSLMTNLGDTAQDSIHNLKYKCAEAKNPQPLFDFVERCEQGIKKGKNLDIMEVVKFSESFHLWIIANVTITQKRNIVDTIISLSLEKVPYIGKQLQKIYEEIQSRNGKRKTKPWWKL